MKQTLILIFILLFTPYAFSQMTNRLDKLEVNDLTTKKLDVVSTTSGSKPCPKMTQLQRDAISSPVEGQCIYNETVKTLNLYNGAAWVEVAGGGGEGGIANWAESTFYEVDDVVIYSGDIYQCTVEHTSTSSFEPSNFSILAQDLASTTGVLSMAKGGTDKSLTPTLGGIVYTDDLSMEVLSAGTSGQFLKSNGAAAPTWDDIPATEVSDSTFSGVLSLSKGGTSKSLTAEDGAILYSDADSVELLSPGTSGQILQSNGAAAPSFVNKSISGKAENGSSVTLEEIQVPNNQLTQTDTNKHLVESGNSNILVNPSFEHSTVSTGWTSSAGTLSEDLSVVVNGKKSLGVNLSSQSLGLTQDSTSYASEFADGVQGLASVRIKTSVSGVKLCARKAGVTQTSLCVDHTGSGKWELLKVPFIFGGTSNGLTLVTDSPVSGDVVVDDAFLGSIDLSATQTFDTTCDTISCQTSFSAVLDGATCAITSVSVPNWISSTIDNGTGDCRINLSAISLTVNPSIQATAEWSGSIRTASVIVGSNFSIAIISSQINGSTLFDPLKYHVTISKQGADYAAAIQAQKDYEKTKISSYSSTNADTDWQACQFSTLAWQGLGTVTSGLKCKRQGSDLLVNGLLTFGTVSSSIAQFLLPTWNGIQLTVKSGTSQPAGRMLRSSTTANSVKDYSVMAYGGDSYLTISFPEYVPTFNPVTPQIGNQLFSTGTSVQVENIRIPIEGWQQSNLIIGQFNGLESCTDTLECTDTFSAKISNTGVVVAGSENVDWIDGNCSVASADFSCTFKPSIFTQQPNCVVSVENATSAIRTATLDTYSSSFVSYRTFDSSTPSALSVYLVCQKQGADYVGKRAKAVASDQNVRSIGSIGMDIQSVYFGGGPNCASLCTSGNCTICSQVGSKITSVSWNSNGQYKINGIDGTKYICNANGYQQGTGYAALHHERASSTSEFAYIYAWSAGSSVNSASMSVTCIGIP